MKRTLNIDDGSIEVEMKNNGRVVGSFWVNPSDLDIIRRFNTVMDKFNAIEFPTESEGEEYALALAEVGDKIKELFNDLLGDGSADAIFSQSSPLALTEKGDFYCENVMSGVSNLLVEMFGDRINKKAARIQKATEKYRK